MTHIAETSSGPTRVEALMRPSREGAKPTPLSFAVRMARAGYAVLSSVFVGCVLLQVFFAGMGAFGANWSWHLAFVHLFGPLPLLMVPVAFVGRMPWGLRVLPLALLVQVGAQFAFASVAVPAAALHPVNALLIFLVGLFVTWRAWSTVAGKR